MKIINRIRKNSDFGLAINKGDHTRLPSFVVYKNKNDLGYIRVGITVSKKLGNAVVRNRIKRQVRAICDEAVAFEKHSLDIVIIVKQGFLERDFNDNKSQICDYMKGL